MESPLGKQHSQSPWAGRWPWLVVMAIILFTGFIRVRLLEMPLERDEGEYAYAGQLILQGIPPYELAYNMKLPGTYYAYALGMAVFGQTVAGIHLTVLVANSFTIAFVFLLGRRLFGLTAGLVAAASYAVMAVSPAVLGLAAHANHFVVFFAVPATWLLLVAEEKKHPMILFSSGLLYGLAFLMKQQGACFGFFGGLYLIWCAVGNHSLLSAGFLKRGAVYVSGIILPLAVFCLACAVAGDFARFAFWTFKYAHDYAAIQPWSNGWDNLCEHLQQSWKVSLGAWLLVPGALVLGLKESSARKHLLFAAIFWVCSFFGTAIGLYFRSHYFILALPAFAILVGAGVVGLQKALPSWKHGRVLPALPVAGFIAILCGMIMSQSATFFEQSPDQFCQVRYAGNPFVEARMAADYVGKHSVPEARIAVLGSEPEIYFYARRHSATGYIYTYPLMEPHRAALAMQHEMMDEIEASKPEFTILVNYKMSWLDEAYSDRTIVGWISQYIPAHYDKVATVGRNEAGAVVASWIADATNIAPASTAQIDIYRRKSE